MLLKKIKSTKPFCSEYSKPGHINDEDFQAFYEDENFSVVGRICEVLYYKKPGKLIIRLPYAAEYLYLRVSDGWDPDFSRTAGKGHFQVHYFSGCQKRGHALSA